MFHPVVKHFFYVIILAAFWQVQDFCKCKNISATGGGIFKLGTDFNLTFKVGQRWERCYWSWLSKENSNSEHCSFDLDPDSTDGVAVLHSCKPKNASKSMKYSGKDVNECTITVFNATEDDNTTWSSRTDGDLIAESINVTIARQIDNVTIHVEEMSLIADTSGYVFCNVSGGRPAPEIALEIGENNSSMDIFEKKLVQVVNEDGIFDSYIRATVRPGVQDYGKLTNCSAIITDKLGVPVFELESATRIPLNISFPPQSMENLTVEGVLEEDITLGVTFRTNPRPQNITWNIYQYRKGKPSLLISSMGPGHRGKKYNTSDLLFIQDTFFRAELNLRFLTHNDTIFLYQLTVANSLGNQSYYLNVKAIPENTTTTNTPSTSTSTVRPPFGMLSKGVIIGVSCFVSVMFLILVSYFAYKQLKKDIQTYPITTINEPK